MQGVAGHIFSRNPFVVTVFQGDRMAADPNESSPPPLTGTPPERLVRDFASRGIVLLSPESLGIPLEVHQRIYQLEKRASQAGEAVTPGSIPEILELLNAPGLVRACDRLLGENWAVVPFSHNATFASGGRDQHWHKDDNAPYNARKLRHHQAVQVEMLYYPQAVAPEMGPTATVPYSHYWTFDHEENQDNFAGADHLDFDYHLSGMEGQAVSGPDSKYDPEEIRRGRTAHDRRMREAVTDTGWPLVRSFEAAPLAAGSVVLYSHNTFHRGNHRRDDWRTWPDRPRFMWRFWLYRTTDAPASGADGSGEVDWREPGTDPMTGIDLSGADDDVTAVWRYHHHWMRMGRPPPPRPEAAALSPPAREREAELLFARLHARHEAAEPVRVGAAYQLASMGDTALAVRLLGEALYDHRESVRRAATYGLITVGEEAAGAFLEAAVSPVKWVRKAGVHGLGDAAPLTGEVLEAVTARLHEDPSVYVRAVAAGALGCLGRRAAATGTGRERIPDCFRALLRSLDREENRLAMDRAQNRSIKMVRPTDDSDVCEGGGVDFGLERFAPVRSAVRENALWSMVILCSHGAAAAGDALEPAIRTLKEVIRGDENVISLGYAMDALGRLAHLGPQDPAEAPAIADLRAELRAVLDQSPVHCWESLVRGGLSFTPD